jgi:3-oxoadipate CoA-transferase, beta subunit
MDVAVGAKQAWVMMDLLTKQGESKLVTVCSYPLTGIGCIKRVYTDLATFDITPSGFAVVDAVEGLSHKALEALVGLSLVSIRA